ncbi:MAG TPA: ABC transporter substrate-binding protein [Kofleriaceae bacterium]|nr:ABC transporter substrate-binding protein [Kofleriaceae bacterium]
MVQRAPQVGVVIAIALIACDSPARVKPWRHAPDPTTEAQNAPPSPVLSAEPTEADVHAARGHTLRIHMDAEPGRLTPILAPSVWARRITLGTVFEPLLRYAPPDAPGGPGHYAPRLARSWRVMPGGQEIRIELEPGVTFHDGRPLTTSDVQFTLDSVRTPGKGVDHLRPLLDDVEAIELITSHEIRLRLKRPSGTVLRALAEIPILPMHVYDGSLLAGGALVGTGPWKYVSNKGGVVHLTKNDKYWGGPPAISDIEFVYQPDAAVALTAAKRGEIDIVPALIPAHWPEQATAPGVTASFKPLQLAPPRLRYLQFNAAHAPLDDDRVRHAVGLLIDRRAIAKRVYDGLARPVLWPVWPGGPVDGPEASVPDFDPAAAGKLLDAAGWIDSDKDGIRDKGGKQLRLVMVGTEKPPAKDASGPPVKTDRDYIIEAARRAGVVIEVKTGGESWVQKRLDEGNYDLIEVAWGGMVDGDLAPILGGKDPRIDRALEEMAAAWDPAERSKLSADLVAALAEAWPIAGIVADAPQGLVHKRVQGVKVWDGWLDLSALRLDASP